MPTKYNWAKSYGHIIDETNIWQIHISLQIIYTLQINGSFFFFSVYVFVCYVYLNVMQKKKKKKKKKAK